MKKEISTLSVEKRDTTKPNVLRRAGKVPGIVYGNIENANITCDAKLLTKLFSVVGESQVFDMELEGKKVPCLIHAISFDPVTSAIDHVDFYAVDMTKKVTTHVPIHFKGEAPVVKTMGGVLVTILHELEVTCLPKDLPSEFVIDISTVDNYESTVLVSHLAVPEGVTIKHSADAMILHVQESRKEEAKVAAATETADATKAPADAKVSAPAADKKADAKK